jgi:hypothetical protein
MNSLKYQIGLVLIEITKTVIELTKKWEWL